MDFPILIQGSPDWMQLRKKQAATCSRFGDAFGVGYNSRAKYMRLKLGLEQPDPSNDLMQFGINNEDWCCWQYKRIMAEKGVHVRLITHGYRRFADDPDSGGSVDRQVEDLATGERWVLEIKTRRYGGPREAMPPSHQLQCVALGELFKVPFVHYMCWSPDDAFHLIKVTWATEFWDFMLWPAIAAFNAQWRSKTIPENMPRGWKANRLDAMKRFIKQSQVDGHGGD